MAYKRKKTPVSEEANAPEEESAGLPKVLLVPLILALLGVGIWVGPSSKAIKVSSTTGRHYVTQKICGITIRNGPVETEASEWMAAQGITMPQDAWVHYKTTVKPLFGSKREAVVPTANVAAHAEALFKALKDHPDGPALLAELIALEEERPGPEATNYSQVKFLKKSAAFQQKVLRPEDNG